MDKVLFDTSETPEINISRVKGSLRLKGWDRAQFRADSDQTDALNATQDNDRIELGCKSGCMVRLPVESNSAIDRVDGDLMIKSVECQLKVKEVRGQVMAKSIGGLEIATVRGHLNVRGMEGELKTDLVNGNANLRDVEGPIVLNKVKGNLVVRGYSPGIQANVIGSTNLGLELSPEGNYHIKSSGSIHCQLASDTSASIQLTSEAKNIRLRINGENQQIKEKSHAIVAGEGESNLILEADGAIELTIQKEERFDWDYEFDFGRDIDEFTKDINLMVTTQIETQLDALGDHLDQLGEDLANVGSVASAEALSRIEAKKHKLERKLAKVERRTTERTRKAARRVHVRHLETSPKIDPVSDEERQKVLEMLQENKITVEDAEILLAALEGRLPDPAPPSAPKKPEPPNT